MLDSTSSVLAPFWGSFPGSVHPRDGFAGKASEGRLRRRSDEGQGRYVLQKFCEFSPAVNVIKFFGRNLNLPKLEKLQTNFVLQFVYFFILFFKNGPFPASFSLFSSFSIQLTVNIQYNFLLMTELEPQTCGIGSDRSTN